MKYQAVYYRHMWPGYRYHGFEGEVQIDPATMRTFYRNPKGEIEEVRPHESSIFYKIDGVTYPEGDYNG